MLNTTNVDSASEASGAETMFGLIDINECWDIAMHLIESYAPDDIAIRGNLINQCKLVMDENLPDEFADFLRDVEDCIKRIPIEVKMEKQDVFPSALLVWLRDRAREHWEGGNFEYPFSDSPLGRTFSWLARKIPNKHPNTLEDFLEQ